MEPTNPIELLLFAGGGHAAEVYSYLADLLAAGQPIRVVGVIDDALPPGAWESTRALGGFDALAAVVADRPGPMNYITCVGNNATRRKLAQQAEALGPNLVAWSLRHPAAYVGRSVEIGAGTLLAPGAVLTTRLRIGRHCIINVNASVHHDCTVGDFVNINPGATVCGGARIGDGAYIGAGATVIQGRSIGANSVIGAGAVVTSDIPAEVTAVGVPARVIKTHRAREAFA